MTAAAAPTAAPASSGACRVRLTAASANATASTSTWAPSTAVPTTNGFRVHSTSTRVPAADGSEPEHRTQKRPGPARAASLVSIQPHAANAHTTTSCQTHTVSRSESPPTSDDIACAAVATGPYTLRVPAHGGCDAEATGSVPSRHDVGRST